MESIERTGSPVGPRAGGRWLWAIVVLALLFGIALGKWGTGSSPVSAADPTVNATATRTAELKELDDLRTQVAQPVVCTPMATATSTAEPSPTPTPTEVPAVASGSAIPYGDDWLITVLGIQAVQTPDGIDANGQLVKVTMKLENLTDKAALPPVSDLYLVDAAGNKYQLRIKATIAAGSKDYLLRIAGHDSATRAIVFDVPANAGSTFLLLSEDEPTFKVELTIEARG